MGNTDNEIDFVFYCGGKALNFDCADVALDNLQDDGSTYQYLHPHYIIHPSCFMSKGKFGASARSSVPYVTKQIVMVRRLGW